MNSRGFSLIELIVVMALIGILLTLATLNFSTWQRKAQVERQVKEMYADIQNARSQAAFTKQRQAVVFGAQKLTFRRYSTSNDAAGTTVTVKNLPLPFTRTGWNQPAPDTILFDTRGIMTDPLFIKVICISTDVDAAYDALIISGAITTMGKVTNRGTACGQNNVTQK